MSQSSIRQQLFRALIADRVDEVQQLGQTYDRVAAWQRQITTHSLEGLPKPPAFGGRRLNNFCIGSDPELIFSHKGQRIDAYSTCGLFVGTAAGSDQNERLAELRPAPSTSVVHHVASILSELRWMYRVFPTTRIIEWNAGAYLYGDGIGGHIHFGRKTTTRQAEVDALNALALTFAALSAFPTEDWFRRMHGDQRGQLYGHFGDIRKQAHGYEYRTLPSWLYSPAVAFIILTAAKLTMFEPELVSPWVNTFRDGMTHLLLLAKFYKGRDDDALMMYSLLQRHPDVLRYIRGDIKAAWGLPVSGLAPKTDVTGFVLPASIEPQPVEVEEIHALLTDDKALGFTEVEPNFVHEVPKGFEWVPRHITPGRHAGVGDVVHNLVWWGKFRVRFVFPTGGGGPITVSNTWSLYWSAAERELFTKEYGGQVREDGNEDFYICIPQTWRVVPDIRRLRELLTERGLFPLWTVDSVRPDSNKLWLAAHVQKEQLKKGAPEEITERHTRRL